MSKSDVDAVLLGDLFGDRLYSVLDAAEVRDDCIQALAKGSSRQLLHRNIKASKKVICTVLDFMLDYVVRDAVRYL